MVRTSHIWNQCLWVWILLYFTNWVYFTSKLFNLSFPYFRIRIAYLLYRIVKIKWARVIVYQHPTRFYYCYYLLTSVFSLYRQPISQLESSWGSISYLLWSGESSVHHKPVFFLSPGSSCALHFSSCYPFLMCSALSSNPFFAHFLPRHLNLFLFYVKTQTFSNNDW